MLKSIPRILSPNLVKIMMEMGHSDIIILSDANYPAKTNAKTLLRMDNCEIPDLLDAMLPFFPLDNFVKYPVTLMKPHDDNKVKIWKQYKQIIEKHDEEKAFKGFKTIDRLDFYKWSQEATVIVQTATTARYANIALQKGVI